MTREQMMKRSLIATVLVTGVFLLGCESSKPAESPDPASDNQFVATDDSVGTISLNVRSTRLGIGDTSGFTVSVRDASGAPVPNIKISCDTERHLALIEPTLGYEMTDQWGSMSGVVGCEAPGSFQIGCRLPIGANKRQFQTIVCQGDAPSGFGGFTEAGGGGIGGGVDSSASERDSELSLNITEISFEDSGAKTHKLDIEQSECRDADGKIDCSLGGVTDAFIVIKVVNNSPDLVRLNSYQYKVDSFTSPKIEFSNGLEVTLQGDGDSVELKAPFAQGGAYGKSVCQGGKAFVGASTQIPVLGSRAVQVTVYGTAANGESVVLEATTSAFFTDYNNCSAS